MQPICPHCGYSLHRDEPIERDGWRIPPYGGVTGPEGVEVPVWSGQQTEVLYAIAAVSRPLSPDALMNRIDIDCERHLAIVLSGIRRACRKAGVPVPFKLVARRRGWAWSAGA